MRADIKADGKRFVILLPNVLVLNSITAKIAVRIAHENGVEVTYEQTKRLFREIRRSKKPLRGLPICDFYGDGNGIVVKL